MDNQVIANIKSLAIDMINESGSGHPGIALGAAPIIYTLYKNHLNVNNNDDRWLNRDRFVLSAGHASALLYSTLYMAGFDIELEDLKLFRKKGSKTPGHPEIKTHGVDMTTGPLGQGFASAVGMALASKIQKNMTTFPNKKRSLIDFNVYVLCSDGDMMEGVTNEAASLAANLKLNNLIILYDSNNVTLDGNLSMSFSENIIKKYKAMGFKTLKVKDGNNINAINKAINKAKTSDRPTLIEIKTIIGKDSLIEGTNNIHGKPLTIEDLNQLKNKLNIPNEPFYTNEEARTYFKKTIMDRSSQKYNEWATNYHDFMNNKMVENKEKYYWLFGKQIPIDINENTFNFEDEMKESTRETNNLIMNEIAKIVPNYLGGSADLFSSTYNYLTDQGNLNSLNYNGKNIWFGVREHAMGAILNGLALCNFKPYGSTFLAFSDYMKPAIRMSALMNLPVTYIFTHDSIYVGEDGPTHQPVEQLVSLRSIPNLFVYRPCDPKEVIGCWNCIINSNKPSALILSRTDVPLLETTSSQNVKLGAYIIRKEQKKLDGIIIATGTEVVMALNIANRLYEEALLDIRVVSMPSQELFSLTNEEYQKELLPKVKTFVIEASSKYSWGTFVDDKEHIISIDQFGISASKDDVSKFVGFNYQDIELKILEMLKNKYNR